MNANRAVLVLTELYFPEETSTGYVLTAIAEGIAAELNVMVICAQPTYTQKGKIAPWSETRNGVEIKRCRGGTLDRRVLPLRALNMLSLSCSLGYRAMLEVRPNDLILVVTNPPLLPFVAAVVAFLKRARLVVLVHDVYPDVLVASGLSRRRSALVKLLEKFSGWLYRSATKVIVIGRDMERLVRERTAGKVCNLAYIPNWSKIDPRPLLEGDRARFLESSGIASSKFIVFYGGNMGRTHGIDDLVLAAEILSMRAADILLVFIGEGSKRGWLEHTVRTRQLNNILMRPSWEFDECLRACDLGLISFVEGMSGVSVPSRMYNIMAAGKAIVAVADEDSERGRVVTEERAGVIVPPSSPERLAAAIVAAAQDRAGTTAMGLRGREAVLRSYTREKVIPIYRTLIKSLVGEVGLHQGMEE